jgi:hypothetical protein
VRLVTYSTHTLGTLALMLARALSLSAGSLTTSKNTTEVCLEEMTSLLLAMQLLIISLGEEHHFKIYYKLLLLLKISERKSSD